MEILSQIFAIIRKDLLMELRDKQVISSMLVFSLIVVVIFNFVFEPGDSQTKLTIPGVLWVLIIFAGNLGLARSFGREREQGGIQGLILCPIDKSYIYIAKVIVNIFFMMLVEAITLPIFWVLFDMSPDINFPALLLVLFLGTTGFAAVGTIFSAISAHTKSSEVMLPILLFPVSVPVVLAASKSTAKILAGSSLGEISGWIKMLIGFDAVFLIACFLLYEYVFEE
ncbi:heme exporter protein CcmB [candidate division KSB1 bacterium]|nr:heme exporter protein CcmB [candidate division KSB1 bacterium]